MQPPEIPEDGNSTAEQRAIAAKYTRVAPVVIGKLPHAHRPLLVVGGQQFAMGSCHTKKDAAWVCLMIAKAIEVASQEIAAGSADSTEG